MTSRLEQLRGRLQELPSVISVAPRSYASLIAQPNLKPDDVFQEIGTEFSFLQSFAVWTNDDVERASGLLSWISEQLARVAQAPTQSRAELVFLLSTVAMLGGTSDAWHLLPVEPSASESFLTAIGDFIAESSCGVDVRRYLHTRYGSAATNGLDEAVGTRDIVALERWMSALQDVLQDDLLRQATFALQRYDMGTLSRTLSRANNFYAIVLSLDCAEPRAALRAASASNVDVKFLAMRRVFDSMGPDGLTPALVSLAAPILKSATLDPLVWARWLEVFNKYPGRFPALQPVFGVVLREAERDVVAAYFSSLALNTGDTISRVHVSRCLEVVRQCESSAQRRLVWAAAYDKWLEWSFGASDPEIYLFDLSGSALDLGVVGYYFECAGPPGRDGRAREIELQLEDVERGWHRSLSSAITAYNRLRSWYQPLAHANHLLVNDGADWLQDFEEPYRAPWQTSFRDAKYRVR